MFSPDGTPSPYPIGSNSHAARGFTLLELLISIGIIGLLIGLLFPAISSVRRTSRITQCANNMRQIASALVNYAGSNHGSFPPNSAEIKQFWYHTELIGRYLSAADRLTDATLARGTLLCPNDIDDAIRSYSMNIYASSYVSSFVRKRLEADPPQGGKLFKFGTHEGSSLILLVESWPELPQPMPPEKPIGHATQSVVGLLGKPGERFGAGKGIQWNDPPDATKGLFDVRASQITFYRHASSVPPHIEDPLGAANFAFADGHVELLRPEELADTSTGKSKYRAMWSTIDRMLE